MARPRKRKRAVSAQGTAQDEPESKKPKISQVYPGPPDGNFQSQHVVLNRFYPQVLTLRGYVLSKLPASSRIRRKKVTAVGLISKSPGRPVSDIEKSLGALLDNTLVGFTQEPKDVSEKRLEEWKNFSQKGDESYVTLSDGVSGYVESQYMILEYVIRALFAKEKRSTWPKHLLCEGFRKNGALGLRSVRPNHHVETIKQSPWPELLALLGESGDQIMIDLLIDCSIFVRVNAGANNFYQISGKPLSDIEALNGGKSREQRTPEDSKSPSEIIFVRNRMLYARAALNARGSVHFGLRHIHVLNRSPFTQIDGCEGQSDQNEQQKKERNSTHTTRILILHTQGGRNH
ncbi:hypothetical protein F4778DRAFT_105027 [Xylariomycetidae sp. FL2044]|nr:hypothetical protein F4778DRAFT_105027 [Xylariomycetidae sp. FL2044]